MALGNTHRSWLLAGPVVVAVGIVVMVALSVLLGPRQATVYGMAFFGAGLFISLLSCAVAVIEHWPPFREWTSRDKVFLAVGASPLVLGSALIAGVAYKVAG